MTVIESTQAKLLIVGDLIVDETWYVDSRKLSPEAPVPVAYLTTPKPHLSPGGASLAASYAHKQNYESVFLTAANRENRLWLEKKGIEIHSLEPIRNVTKTRYIDVNSNYHLLRVDNDEVVDFPVITPDRLRPVLEGLLDNISCLVMLDYRKGIFLNTETTQMMIKLAVSKGIPVYVDTRCNVDKFRQSTFLKLNEKEYVAAAAAQDINTPQELCKKLNVPNVIITKGKLGAELYTITGNSYKYSPTVGKHTGTPDVTGCGDVFDVNFCYYYFKEGLQPTEVLELSVEKATEYAYTSIGDRLC